MNTLTTHPTSTILGGKFRVIRQLGKGGMGAVYEVEHEAISQRRALKIVGADETMSQATVRRFQHEAKAPGIIQNAHIVEVYDAGELPSGERYVVMDLLEGETLERFIERKGKLDLDEMCDLVAQACDGVQAAHDAGIIHRDLKPANLFVTKTPDGKPFVKVLDFGIAKFRNKSANDTGMTKENTFLGTPYYMSPEQFRNAADIDARADVYALGVILYECAAGKPPYETENLAHLGMLIREAKPKPLAKLRPDLPERFRHCVKKAMARDKVRRFRTVAELAEELRMIRAQPDVPLAAENSAEEAPVAPIRINRQLKRDTVQLEELPGLDPRRNKVVAPVAPMGRTEKVDNPPDVAPLPDKPAPPLVESVPKRDISRRWVGAFVAIMAIAAGAIALWAGITRAERPEMVAPVGTTPMLVETAPTARASARIEEAPIEPADKPSLAIPSGSVSATPSSRPNVAIQGKTVSSAKRKDNTDFVTSWRLPRTLPHNE